jgi:hypothetical protein
MHTHTPTYIHVCMCVCVCVYIYIYIKFVCGGGQDSAVGIATHYRLDGPGFKPPWGQETFFSPYRRGLTNLLYNDYEGSCPGINLPGRGVDLASSTEPPLCAYQHGLLWRELFFYFTCMSACVHAMKSHLKNYFIILKMYLFYRHRMSCFDLYYISN